MGDAKIKSSKYRCSFNAIYLLLLFRLNELLNCYLLPQQFPQSNNYFFTTNTLLTFFTVLRALPLEDSISKLNVT